MSRKEAIVSAMPVARLCVLWHGQAELQKKAQIPGMVHPHEVQEEMVD